MNAEKIKEFFKKKPVKIVFLGIAALALLFAVWKVFFNDKSSSTDAYRATEEERRLSALLEKIEGVDGATVMISRDESATSVVVVFEGEDGILTRLRITEVAASALNIAQSKVLVYAS